MKAACQPLSFRVASLDGAPWIAKSRLMQIMQNLLLEEGSIVSIKSATLPKGSFVKLQPHTKDFLDISNPKAVLERTLRGYACLTKGDTICLPYNNKKYFIDVVEARPQVVPLKKLCLVYYQILVDWLIENMVIWSFLNTSLQSWGATKLHTFQHDAEGLLLG